MGKATFLDGNEDIKIKEVIESNSSMDIVHISFAANSKDEIIHINIANGIILDLSLENCLVGVWVKDVVAR
ncbi:MAG: hypothetical protein KAR07_07130 [Spirochaetes bacterium]|nr:hypothetical protein [Spirochaetota bacterium]